MLSETLAIFRYLAGQEGQGVRVPCSLLDGELSDVAERVKFFVETVVREQRPSLVRSLAEIALGRIDWTVLVEALRKELRC